MLLQVIACQARYFCVVLDDQNLQPRAFHDSASVHEGYNLARIKHKQTQSQIPLRIFCTVG